MNLLPEKGKKEMAFIYPVLGKQPRVSSRRSESEWMPAAYFPLRFHGSNIKMAGHL